MTSVCLLLALITAPPIAEEFKTESPLDSASIEEQKPLEPFEIRKIIRVALKDEATSDSFDNRRKAIVRLCALYSEMMINKDFAELEKQKWQAKLTARLRGVRSDAEKSLSEKSTSTTSDDDARGGGAIDERGANELIELITTTLDPETWEVHGGKGSIFYFSNYRVLVVRQTLEVHEKLGGVARRLNVGP